MTWVDMTGCLYNESRFCTQLQGWAVESGECAVLSFAAAPLCSVNAACYFVCHAASLALDA